MARLALTINDDSAQQNSNGAVTLTDTTVAITTLSAGKGRAAFRITNVTIPQGATIQHAEISFALSSIGTSGGNTIAISGQAADNAGVLTTTTNDISTRTKTTANTTVPLDDLGNGTYVFDITAVVQEIVNRAGWASGNALCIIVDGPQGSTAYTISMSESGSPPTAAVIYGDSADSERPTSVSGTGSFTNPNNAFVSDNIYATTANLSTAAQIWESFNIASLTGATITGILVRLEAKVSSGSSNAQYTAEISWDGGTSWTTPKATTKATSTDATFYLGGADLWDHSFVPSELTNSNFKVRITNSFASGTEDASIDYVAVKVFYVPAPPKVASVVMIGQGVKRASTY